MQYKWFIFPLLDSWLCRLSRRSSPSLHFFVFSLRSLLLRACVSCLFLWDKVSPHYILVCVCVCGWWKFASLFVVDGTTVVHGVVWERLTVTSRSLLLKCNARSHLRPKVFDYCSGDFVLFYWLLFLVKILCMDYLLNFFISWLIYLEV